MRAEKALKFLVDAFRKPDPAADGRSLKVIDLLDRAVKDLDGSMAGQPLMQATLYNAIGETFSAWACRANRRPPSAGPRHTPPPTGQRPPRDPGVVPEPGDGLPGRRAARPRDPHPQGYVIAARGHPGRRSCRYDRVHERPGRGLLGIRPTQGGDSAF